MRDQRGRRPARRVQQPEAVDPAPGRPEPVLQGRRADILAVTRMQLLHHRGVAFHQQSLRSAERLAAAMAHEHARHGHMPPAEMGGTQAPIVLLAIALGKDVLTQQPGFHQAGALQQHAEPDARRDVHDLARVRRPAQLIQPAEAVPVRHFTGFAGCRIGHDGPVIGHRRARPDRRVGMRRRRQPLEPFYRHHRVRVQDHHVPVRGRAEMAQPGINRRRKSARPVMGQHDRPHAGRLRKPDADCRIGAPVVDQNEPAAPRQAGLDRTQAKIEPGQPGIHRDHHVASHAAPRRRARSLLPGARQQACEQRTERIRLSRLQPGQAARRRTGRRSFGAGEQRAAPEMPPLPIHDADRTRCAAGFGRQGEPPPGPLVLDRRRRVGRQPHQLDGFRRSSPGVIDRRDGILVRGTPRPAADPAGRIRTDEPVHRREPRRAQPAAEQRPPRAGRDQALRPRPILGQGTHLRLPRTQPDATGRHAVQAEPR